MPSLPDQLATLLKTVRTPGDFCTAGTAALLMPRLQVQGVGPIALPLLPVQAEQLIAMAERAPYGQGGQTRVDTAVRRTWQIGPDRLRVEGKHWAQGLAGIVERAAVGLGVTGKVLPELYKLLVYDEGSFFVSHRDTEKAPGMFATLIIALPSNHAGGELLVRHKGRELRLDLQCPDPSEVAYAAFYADCVHEVLPVTAGCRLALVYNLLRHGPGRVPQPPDYAAEQVRLAALLGRWSGAKATAGDTTPEKLVYLLEHAYTPAELSFEALKGADAAAATVLAAATAQSGCDLHAALLTIEESGAANECGPDEFEIIEVCDRTARLSNWRRSDGGPTLGADLPLENGEVSPSGALDDMEPDDEFFQEATGNEGASFERTYGRAALVLWPARRRLAVLNQAGLAATLPLLTELAAQWVERGEGAESPLWQQAHELSGHMLHTWPGPVYGLRAQDRSKAGELLAQLARLKDKARIGEFLTDLATAGRHHHGAGDNPDLLQALGCLPPGRAGEWVERVVAAHAPESPGSCADLLSRACTTGRDVHWLAAAARALVAALPGDQALAPKAGFTGQGPTVDGNFVADLLTMLERVDTGLAERACAHVLAWPATYGLDAVVVPAARRLAAVDSIRSSRAMQRLRTACLDHLRSRVAQALAPPADASRAVTLRCRCKPCSEFARFMASPHQLTWAYKAAEFERSHLASSIRQAVCDVDCSTDKHGRPYSLVCTKNQASYERRARQRKQDLEDLAQLGG